MYMLGIPLGLGLAELPIGTWKLNGLTVPCIWLVQFMLYATIYISCARMDRECAEPFYEHDDE